MYLYSFRSAIFLVLSFFTVHHIYSPDSNPFVRQDFAVAVRVRVAALAFKRKVSHHVANGDERRYSESLLASFTKGFPHNPTSAVIFDPKYYDHFIRSINTGRPEDQRRVPMGPPPGVQFESSIAKDLNLDNKNIRGFASSSGGLSFVLQGADPQLFSIPPAPKLDSKELAVEMIELYGMALLRDMPFIDIEKPETPAGERAARIAEWLNDVGTDRGPFSAKKLFRGVLRGDDDGPIISQFLLVGTTGLDGMHPTSDGIVQYGGSSINQRVRIVTPNKDYMTTWAAHRDVQNGAAVGKNITYVTLNGMRDRFIATPRDLATYVHVDFPYQGFLTAALMLLQNGIPYDKGIPFQEDDHIDKQRGLSHWSGQHVLTLLAEISTRALKASQFQKFNVHRRARPEEIGGYLDRYLNTKDPAVDAIAPLASLLNPELLKLIAEHNDNQNSNPEFKRQGDDNNGHKASFLLPMAYPEASPMHPSYPAGHAVLSGACATILKAFFDHTKTLSFAYEASADGQKLQSVTASEGRLTVEGELNKLASNIAIGRDIAGIHYYTDYHAGVRLGEKLAISLLEEQAYTFTEDFSMTIPTFDRETVLIKKTGRKVTVFPGSYHD